MSFDLDALTCRLFADALAAGLRWHLAFCDVRTTTTWEEIEIRVRERAKQHAMDLSASAVQVESAMEKVHQEWRKATKPHTSLREIDLLCRGARTLLQRSGREMILRADRENPGREILRWRFVSLSLPAGILMAAATEPGFVAPKSVRLLDASIAPDFSVAQNHLHHAALPAFEDLWVSLRVRALTQPGDFASSIQQVRAYCPRLHRGACLGAKTEEKESLTPVEKIARAKHLSEWADLIRQAFIARRVIDRHSWHSDPFADCADAICQTARTILGPFVAGETKPYSLSGTRYPWPEERELLLREVRRSADSAARRRLAGASADLLLQESRCERRVLARAFDCLCSKKCEDREYEKVFLQYLRVKTALFGLLVHSPGERGLAKFVQHFKQIKVYAHEADKLEPRTPVEPGLDVRATEYRVAPDAWLATLRYDSERNQVQETAWIIHFKREGAGTGLPLYGEQCRKIRGEAETIANALDQKPARLRMLRGIDICGVEGKQPLWVAAQTLLRLRARSRDTAAMRPADSLEPLRLTLHVGEDFEWLTSGMRAVAEPFHWHLIERGDRIGHGIAVTLDPREWWDRHKGEVIEVTRFDRLLDLAFLSVYCETPGPEQNKWLQLEVETVARELWPDTENKSVDFIFHAKEVWRHLGRPTTLRLMDASVPFGEVPQHEEWLRKYLWDRGTQRRAKEIIRMKIYDDANGEGTGGENHERELLCEARERLIREIALWQVCIESNPSSNLVIASLDSTASQDFLQIRPTAVARRGAETLTWTISTDNPITFSTSLADEYAYAWAGMVRREERAYDPSYARALLDEAAATSMRMRFTTRYGREGAVRPHR